MGGRSSSAKWRVAVLIGTSVLLGATLAPLPGFSHVGGTVKHLWKQHIRPKADVRYSTRVTTLPVNCVSAASFTGDYTKIADFGTFDKALGPTQIEASFEGRIQVDTLTNTSGAIFELRVDDLPSADRARANVRGTEVGATGSRATFSGIFEGLGKGTHTVSVWVRAGGSGTGTGGRVDPGCWSTDEIVIKESM